MVKHINTYLTAPSAPPDSYLLTIPSNNLEHQYRTDRTLKKIPDSESNITKQLFQVATLASSLSKNIKFLSLFGH